MNYAEIVSKLLSFGLSPIPVAPYQDPNDKTHPFHKYLHQSKKVTDTFDYSVSYEPILDPDGSLKAKFTGKNPSFLKANGFPKIIEHKNYQGTLPTQEELLEWFANPKNGIGSLGSYRYRWLDLDRKHFANQGDCDLALLSICPHAQDGWLEQTQSGGYRLLIDCGESGADFTNFALSEGGDHVGELLGAGRYAVMAPTVGVNGAYENLNYGDPIPLAEINIFTTSPKQAPVTIKASLPLLNTIQGAIELFNCITPATQSILTGNPESNDRSADLTKAAKELYGWENWLNANSISFNGSVDQLINDCGDALGIGGDRIERIKKTIDSGSCLPACVIRGGDESAQMRVKKLSDPSPKTAAAPNSDTLKKYHVEFVHLCSNRTQRILMGESERVTIATVTEAYQELRAWELALSSFPDTTATTSVKKIVESICDENDLDVELVNFKATPKSLINKTLINETVRTWRYKFLEGDAEFEKAQYFALKGRVQRLLNTNLKFNTQMDNWYEYVDGVFVLREKDRIHGTIRHHLKLLQIKDWRLKSGLIKEATVKEYLENMKGNSITEKMDDHKKTLGLINLQDGTYDRINKILLDHQQEHGFTVQLPYKWRDAITASASPIVRWLWDSLDGKIDQVFFALCYLNAIVTRRSDIQVLLQIIGKAGAGKSTFTRLAEALVGSSNVQSTQLQLLEEDKFELSNLIGRPLVLINEIDTNYKGSGAILKGLTGGDRMVNRIKHKQSRGNCDFTYNGKIIITANEEFKPSRVFDDWDRRNRVLKFHKVVAKSKVRNLIENCEDGSIAGEFAPHLPAFLQLILSIDDTLVKQVLIEPEVYAPSMGEIRDESILRESSIAQWLEECVIFNPDAKTYIGIAKKSTITVTENGVSKSQVIFENGDSRLSANYAQWCTDRGMAFTGFQRFSPDLLRIVNGIMKIDYVKKLNHDKIGTAIAGLELRTRYHDHIPTPIKGFVASGEDNQTLTDSNVDVNQDKTLIYKLFLQEFIEELSDTPIDTNNNNLNNLEDNDLHICTSKASSVFEANIGVEASTVAVEVKLRPLTISDFGKTIINIVDNTSGVLVSLGHDVVRYGDFTAPPQNVRAKVE